MRVAIYVPHGAIPDKRGFAPAIVAWNHARRLKAVSPLIISAREHYPSAYEMVDGIPVYRIGEGRLYRRLFRKATRLDPYPLHRRAAKIVNREAPDLFHAHQLEFPVADFLRTLGRRLPVIVHVHAVRKFDPALGVADKYLAVSEYTKELLVERGYPVDRTEVVYNGVDTGIFIPPTAKEKLRLKRTFNIATEACVVSYIGRKQESKGFHSFLKVADELLRRHENLFVLSAGPALYERDAERDSIKNLLTRLKDNPRFQDFPSLQHDKLSSIYKITDIVLLPTQHGGEQHPLVVVEAMASGCLTIATAMAGINETIHHGITGLLIKNSKDLEELVEMTDSAIRNPAEMARIGIAAREHAVATFDWNIAARKLEMMYDDLAGQ
jgi:UDP-N-acetylglucosamine:(glucosyl)LPS alpha-1,2-N-acetylglucosaminyltransferase